MSKGPFESEIALIIKDNVDHTKSRLDDMRSILEFDLRPKPPQIIHDTYYDTRENLLREKKITLRTRRVGGTQLISSKSDIRRIAGAIIRRREMELPWSYNSVRLLARNLGLKTTAMSVSRFQDAPAPNILTTIGLDAIQERRTSREARDVIGRGESSASVVAELAIDTVTYIFNRAKVGLSEVEVEAKAAKSLGSVRGIADALVSMYRPNLQHWSHGKFVTGLAIRKLLETKAFQSYLVNRRLKPEAFELIDRTVRYQKF